MKRIFSIALFVVRTVVVTTVFPAEVSLAETKSEYLEIEGYPEPHTPAEHNKLGAIRYWREGKQDPIGVVLIPGNGGGAPSLDIVARWLVNNAGAQVWAIDRRANRLEDHRGTEQALTTKNALAGVMYYMGPDFISVKGTDVPFLQYWGLPVHLNDVFEVIKEARAHGAKRVFLGGHSLGAMMSQAYAAYELPDAHPGYEDVDGLILFDGSLWGPHGTEADIEQRIAEVNKQMDEGQLFPEALFTAGVASELIAIAAVCDPDGQSPIAPLVAELTKIDEPVTNLALFGVSIDTEYAFHRLCRAGKLAEPDLNTSGKPRTWVRYADVDEVTDALTLAKSLVTGRGACEWYQPLALVRDVGVASNAMLNVPELGFKYHGQMDKPVIAFLANSSGYRFKRGLENYATTVKGEVTIIEIKPDGTYGHLDPIVAADADTRVFTPLKQWIEAVLAAE